MTHTHIHTHNLYMSITVTRLTPCSCGCRACSWLKTLSVWIRWNINFVYSTMTSRSHKATNNDLHLLESQLRNEVHRLSAKSHTTSIRKKQTSDTHIRYDAKTGKRIQQDKPRRRTKRKTVQMAQASVGK